MTKQMKIGLVVVGLVAVIGAGVYGSSAYMRRVADAKTTPSPAATATPSAATQLTYAGQDGKTALELLKAKDPKAATKGDGANAYVTSVGGYAASDTKKEYWAFYVNGKLSDVGAGTYVTKSSDQISWKIATY